MRPRSDKTEIQYLRRTLRHARTVLDRYLFPRVGEVPPHGYAKDVLRFIDDALAPKRRASPRSDQGSDKP